MGSTKKRLLGKTFQCHWYSCFFESTINFSTLLLKNAQIPKLEAWCFFFPTGTKSKHKICVLAPSRFFNIRFLYPPNLLGRWSISQPGPSGLAVLKSWNPSAKFLKLQGFPSIRCEQRVPLWQINRRIPDFACCFCTVEDFRTLEDAAFLKTVV